MGKKYRKEYLLKSVLNALSLLEQFHDDVEELSLSQLSRLTSLNKNSVFRLLATLESRSYVEQNRINDHYRLGIKNYHLGAVRLGQTELVEKSRPVMELLAAQTRETVSLAVRAGSEIFHQDVIHSQLPVRVVIPEGGRLYPLHATAAGKIMLACNGAGDKIAPPLTGRLVPRTTRTITDPKVLLRELKEARNAGYATDDEEADLGARSVAAPIYNHNSEVVAALCVAGPVGRLTRQTMEDELGPMLVMSAQLISRSLGHQERQQAGEVIPFAPGEAPEAPLEDLVEWLLEARAA